MDDQLGDHRVVVHRDLATLVHPGVDAHAVAFDRRQETHQAPGGRQEAAERVFCVDPALHRPADQRDVVLRHRQLLAGGDADHLLDQIDAGDVLGHRVLDLQAGVHLEEVEVLVGTDDELDGAGRLVLHRLGQRDRLFAHRLARLGVEEGARRLFDDLLVTPLDRTLPLVQIERVAERVGQDLDLDVPRLDDEFLDEHPVVAERVLGLVAAGREALEGLLVVVGDAQALAAAAGGRLDHHRVADVAGDFDSTLGGIDRVVVARDGVDLGFVGELLRGDLVAHGRHRLRLRADEGNARGLQPARELLVLGQEAVARMHRFGAGLLAGVDDLVHHQVGLGGGRRSDAHRLVGHVDVQRALVGLGIDGDRLDTHLARRLDHAARDFATVGNQNLLEHVRCPPGLRAECCRACATGFRASCPSASPASGRCACASRAASRRRR